MGDEGLPEIPGSALKTMNRALKALDRLKQGNRRFVANIRNQPAPEPGSRRYTLPRRQEPVAIIIGCSDARVPAEIIFDQGLGDLFVIRIAGNVIAPSQVGSVEFAVEKFDTPLVLVLGHSRCGAVMATLEALARPGENHSPNLQAIVGRIQPAVEPLLASGNLPDSQTLIDQAVKANIRSSTRQLCGDSRFLESLVTSGRLLILGAEYSLDTGEVEFFEPPGS